MSPSRWPRSHPMANVPGDSAAHRGATAAATTSAKLKQWDECKGVLERALTLNLSPGLADDARRALADCSEPALGNRNWLKGSSLAANGRRAGGRRTSRTDHLLA